MKLVVATESSTLMRWCRASLLASPTVLPASMVPWRWITPVRARIASSSVVLPLWYGPTSATQRGPVAGGSAPATRRRRDPAGGRLRELDWGACAAGGGTHRWAEGRAERRGDTGS